MKLIREWLVRLRNTVRAGRRDADLEQELRLHMELAAEAEGRHDPRSVGLAHAMDAMRDQRGLPWLEDLVRDLRYGIRMLALTPGFTVVAIVSLAIGIGANCAVFSFADALILRPLAVPEPDTIVTVGAADLMGGRSVQASYPEYLDIRNRTTTIDSLVAFASTTVAVAKEPGEVPKARIGLVVTGNFFEAMRVPPAIGRTFRGDEAEVPGRNAVVVLGHEFWTRAFNADPAIVGRTLRFNGTAFTVIGVAPDGFTGLDRYTRFEFFTPLMMWPTLSPEAGVRLLEARDMRRLTIKGRLKTGATLAQAQSELALLTADLERAFPATNRNRPLIARTELQDRLRQNPSNGTLVAMLAFLAVGVLFVACANVAGLLASRAPLRAREIAMRLAVGAGRARIVRQLVTESLLIALAGGAAGLAVGYAGVLLFRQFRIPTDLPIAVSFRLDHRALAISMVVAAASAVLFGLTPALRAARADLTSVMKANDAGGFSRRRGRSILVGGQVAMAVVLLAVATYIYRDFQMRLDGGPGFRRDHLLEMWFDPGLIGYDRAATESFYERLTDRVRRTGEVRSATLTSFVPTDGGAVPVTLLPEGFVYPIGQDSSVVWSASVDEHHLQLLQIPLLSGRAIAATDRAGAPHVAVVNEEFARRYWPNQPAIGKRFRLRNTTGPWVEIVGVVKTIKYSQLLESPIEFVYFPRWQKPQSQMALVVETAGDPAAAVPAIQSAIADVDAGQPIYNLRPFEDTYSMRVVSIMDIIVRFIGAMGVMGLVLSIVGLYGLVSYAASRRTKEIGIRMAIGANRGAVLKMILGQGAWLVLAGLTVGLAGGAGAARVMRGIFPANTMAPDRAGGTLAFSLVALTVLVVTMIAAYLPARRAARINPTDALRHD